MDRAPRWILVLLAGLFVWLELSHVPVRATFTRPDGTIYRRDFRSYGSVAAWEVPDAKWVDARFSDRKDTWIPEDARVIAYKSWGDGIGDAALWWMLACGLLWPIFWLLRRRPGWAPAARLSLVCFISGFVAFNLMAAAGDGGSGAARISLPLLGLALVTGRAAGATEDVRPWFGMVAGTRACVVVLLGFIIVPSAVALGVWVCSLVAPGIAPGVTIAILSAAALGVAPMLCLAPAGQLRPWSRHFLVVASTLSLGQMLAFTLEVITVALAPPGALEPMGWSEGATRLSGCAIWVGAVIAAVPFACLYLKAAERFRTPASR